MVYEASIPLLETAMSKDMLTLRSAGQFLWIARSPTRDLPTDRLAVEVEAGLVKEDDVLPGVVDLEVDEPLLPDGDELVALVSVVLECYILFNVK